MLAVILNGCLQFAVSVSLNYPKNTAAWWVFSYSSEPLAVGRRLDIGSAFENSAGGNIWGVTDMKDLETAKKIIRITNCVLVCIWNSRNIVKFNKSTNFGEACSAHGNVQKCIKKKSSWGRYLNGRRRRRRGKNNIKNYLNAFKTQWFLYVPSGHTEWPMGTWHL